MIDIARYKDKWDIEPTFSAINSYRELPFGSENKEESGLWSPLLLKRRKCIADDKVKVHTLVYDYDYEILPSLSEYRIYVHQTHKKRWRIIAPLEGVLEIKHSEFHALHEMGGRVLGIPKKHGDQEGYDDQASLVTTFFYLPPPNVSVILKNPEKPKIDPLYVPTNSFFANSNSGFIAKHYPPINEDLITRIRDLHKVFKNDMGGVESCFGGKHRFECHFHLQEEGSSPREIMINADPFSLYSFHESCESSLREVLKAACLPEVDIDGLNYTELYLISGIHRKLWDVHTLERMYVSTFLYERFANVLRLTGEIAVDNRTILDLLYGSNILYDPLDRVFYLYSSSEKVHREIAREDIGVALTGEIYRWFSYRFTRYKGNKGANMKDQRLHLADRIRANTMGHVSTPTLALENGNLTVKEVAQFVDIKFEPHSGLFFAKKRLKYSYDPKATCPLFKKCINKYFHGDDESKAVLQEFFGYCLLDHRRYEKFLLMYGVTRSGKTTLAKVLQFLVGGQPTSLDELDKNITRYSVSKSRMIMCDERVNALEGAKMTENMKMLVSSGDIPCRTHYGEEHGVSQFPKIVLSFNDPPSMEKVDPALQARMLVLNFQRSFLAEENTRLYDQLIAEAPGILNWAIEGLRRLIESDRFTVNQKRIDTLINEMRGDNDKFIESMIKELDNGTYYLKELYDEFIERITVGDASELDLTPMTIRMFSKYATPYFTRKSFSGGLTTFIKGGRKRAARKDFRRLV